MSKLRSNASASQPPVTILPNDSRTFRHRRAARDGNESVGHGDPLPWLIRQLRGRYDVNQIIPPATESSPGISGDAQTPDSPPQ